MLIVHRDEDDAFGSDACGELPVSVIWIDMLEPTADEIARVERRIGLSIPGDALARVSASSRLMRDERFLCLNTPVVSRGSSLELNRSPAGFLLSPDLLVTVRHAALPCFGAVADQIRSTRDLTTAAAVFAALIGEIVELGAEVLEDLGTRIERISHSVFRGDPLDRDHPVRSTATLRSALGDIGVLGEGIGQVRDVLLGAGRISAFVRNVGDPWASAETCVLLREATTDIAALNDYAAHLSGKDQFLLEAVLGYITVEQNDLFRVLTIAAVVGIPPTLLAGVWGMNFAAMPELVWRWGYPVALAAIAASAAAPLIWFKRRG